ncbi:MAG: hemerythrin domain-containing protein [Verrucomicrobiota bacterium]|nr:hemerythrin domain-containing protein [Verrucomicrobiota bacterium]
MTDYTKTSELKAVQPIRKLKWEKFNETGIKILDLQHELIYFNAIQILNSYDNADKKELGNAFLSLQKSLLSHLFFEENIMLEYEYPDFEKHRKIHNMFREKFKILKAQYTITALSKEFLEGLDNLMQVFILYEMREADLQLVVFLKKTQTFNKKLARFLKKIVVDN